jgi:thioredoxin reductase (NADPH)
MQKRVLENSKVSVAWNSVVTSILGLDEGKFRAARVKNVDTGVESEIEADGFFVAIGHRPNTSLFAGLLDLDPSGYIATVPGSAATSVPGVFAAGDVQDTVYKQAVTAAGSGCQAAIEASRYLEELGE